MRTVILILACALASMAGSYLGACKAAWDLDKLDRQEMRAACEGEGLLWTEDRGCVEPRGED